MSQPSPSGASYQRLSWLRNAILRGANVRSATFDTDPSGQPFLRIELAGASESLGEETGRSAVDSLLAAELTPMLIFDVESLEIVQSNTGARQLMGIGAHAAEGGPSLADLFDQSELDRLGSLLATLPATWAEFGTWLIRQTNQERGQSVRTWCGPADVEDRRLLLATPATA